MQFIQVPDTLTPTGHYSQAVVANNVVYVSGILPANMTTGERFGHLSVTEQTQQVLTNLGLVLNASGSHKMQVVKLTIFIASAAYWGEVNAACASHFGDHRPARSIIPVPELYNNCALELEAVAVMTS